MMRVDHDIPNDDPPPTAETVVILHLEDSPLDAELAKARLNKSGLRFTIERVDTREQFVAALERQPFDLILSDYNLPHFDGSEALAIVGDRWPHVPFIFVSGVLGEDVAIESIKSGATDYVLKQRLDRLAPAVRRALAETAERAARQRAERRSRESEERYRSLVSVLTDVPWTTDADGQFDRPEAAWAAYTGQAWPQHRGVGWLDALHPDDRSTLRHVWHVALATGEPFETDCRLWHAMSDAYRYVVIRAIALRHADGTIREWVGTCTDVHSARVAEQERERLLASEQAARREAEQANLVKDEFLATLSHELRTPLNAILGWSQLISTGDWDPAEAKEGLQAIVRNARVQSQIIDDLLDMSRIISGKVRLEPSRINVAGIVEEAVESVMPTAQARGIRLVRITDFNGHPINGDAGRLQQVFWNLLSNAIKFTATGGEVHVAVRGTGGHVEISIRDTGEGIDARLLPHVFDRFRQADGSTTRRHGGLGLGLSIVKQLVEVHGGTVVAESPGLGLGATFTVTLPLATPDARPPGATPAVDGIAASPEPLGLSGVRVLVVDDEPDARTLIARILRGRGATVTCVGTAAEALAVVRTERPDVLVSDIGMPGEDGYALIRQIRRLPPAEGGATPAIAFTAFAREEDRRHALVAGFEHHLPKPIEATRLTSVIAAAASRRPAPPATPDA